MEMAETACISLLFCCVVNAATPMGEPGLDSSVSGSGRISSSGDTTGSDEMSITLNNIITIILHPAYCDHS